MEKTTINSTFQYPNSFQIFREIVGGYIYEKLGRSGLIVTMQDFEHELPLTEYAKVYFDETLV